MAVNLFKFNVLAWPDPKLKAHYLDKTQRQDYHVFVVFVFKDGYLFKNYLFVKALVFAGLFFH